MNVEGSDLFYDMDYIEGVTDYAQWPEFVIMLREKVHKKGQFKCIYCSEYDGLSVAEHTMINILDSQGVPYHVGHEGGEYFMGKHGPGWFTIVVGCPLGSGPTELYVDESIEVWQVRS